MFICGARQRGQVGPIGGRESRSVPRRAVVFPRPGPQVWPWRLLSVHRLQNWHCLLDVAPHAIERLHHMHIYPIVIFIHYKSAKHIK